MIGSALVVFTVILDEEGHIVGNGQIHATAAAGVFALCVLSGTQIVQRDLMLVAFFLAVFAVKMNGFNILQEKEQINNSTMQEYTIMARMVQ